MRNYLCTGLDNNGNRTDKTPFRSTAHVFTTESRLQLGHDAWHAYHQSLAVLQNPTPTAMRITYQSGSIVATVKETELERLPRPWDD